MSRISIKDVAKYAGVSSATVSQVLSGKGRISEATRAKVQKAFKETGYVYNQNAANLRQKRSNHIGLLLHDISNPFYGEMTAGIAKVVDNHDNMLFLSNSEDLVEKQEKLTKALIQNGAEGIIICASNDTPDDYFNYLKKGKTPVVLVTRHKDKDLNFVGTDNVLAGKIATEHLLSLGHKRIAFVGGEASTRNRKNRLSGYIMALYEAGITYDDQLDIPTASDRKSGREAIIQILNKHPDVTACVFYQDIIAHGAMLYLSTNNIVAGKDISIIGLDDVEESALLSPALTSVSFSAEEMGFEAGELLFDIIDDNNKKPKTVIVQPRLIIRESSGEASLT